MASVIRWPYQPVSERINPLPLPALTEEGDLPPGIHVSALPEIIERFGNGPTRRRIMAGHLERVYSIAQSTGHLARFIVFGSFVTNKPEPNDVDVFLLMEDTFDVSRTTGESRLLFDHAAAQAHFGASVFWLRRLAVLGREDAAIEDWQIKRDGNYRGILEIVSELP